MKKILSMAMAALLLAGMASCNNSSSNENTQATEEAAPDYGKL